MNSLSQTQSLTRRQTLRLFATGAAGVVVVTTLPAFANEAHFGNHLSLGSNPKRSENAESSQPFVLSF